jgi:hypothetical protein
MEIIHRDRLSRDGLRMFVWTKQFPRWKRPLGYWRLLRARHRFEDNLGVRLKPSFPFVGTRLLPGYRSRLTKLWHKHKGKRCFVIGNGPSLKKMDLSPLKNELTIGFNGLYKAFPEWGWHTNYMIFEDIEQTELRGPDIGGIDGPTLMSSVYNAYCFRSRSNMILFNARLIDSIYWKNMRPLFSRDFANIVYLGSTVTYIGLQLAYHFGCPKVYLIGVDNDYGELPKLFPPGKITITGENIHLVRGVHFSDKYYKIGDQIGVPNVEAQEGFYRKAREEFEAAGRKIYNAGVDSKLDVFERVDFNSLVG